MSRSLPKERVVVVREWREAKLAVFPVLPVLPGCPESRFEYKQILEWGSGSMGKEDRDNELDAREAIRGVQMSLLNSRVWSPVTAPRVMRVLLFMFSLIF